MLPVARLETQAGGIGERIAPYVRIGCYVCPRYRGVVRRPDQGNRNNAARGDSIRNYNDDASTPSRRPNLVSVGTIVWLSSELMFFAALFAMYFTIRSVTRARAALAGRRRPRTSRSRRQHDRSWCCPV